MHVETAIHPCAWTGSFDSEGLKPALAGAAQAGFDYLVVPLRRPEIIDPVAIARAFAAAGLRPINTAGVAPDSDIGSPDCGVRMRGIARLREATKLARDMGSKQINGVLYGPIGKAEHPADKSTILRTADAIAALADDARRADIRIALELVNRYETNRLNTVEDGLSFLDSVGHDNVFLHLDTFHMAIEEADPVTAMRRALPKLAYFELDQSHRGPLREGTLDLGAWLKKLARSGYRGIVGVEAFSRGLMAADHADGLAIWRDRFENGDALAAEAMDLIRLNCAP